MCQIEKCTHTYTQIVRQGETRGCQHRNVARWNQEDDSPSVSWNWTTWKLPWLPVEEEKGGEERRRSSKTTWPWACKQERGHNGVCASVMCVPLCMIRQAILLSAILLVTVAYREKKKKKSNLIHYYLPPRKKKEMSKFLRLSKHLRFNIVRDIMVVTLKKKKQLLSAHRNCQCRRPFFVDLTAVCWLLDQNLIYSSSTLDMSGGLEWLPKWMHMNARGGTEGGAVCLTEATYWIQHILYLWYTQHILRVKCREWHLTCSGRIGEKWERVTSSSQILIM